MSDFEKLRQNKVVALRVSFKFRRQNKVSALRVSHKFVSDKTEYCHWKQNKV